MDTHSILHNVSIVSLIESDLGLWKKRSGRWYFWLCPFHPDNESPSLAVTPDNGRYYCFSCGKNGDGITWLRDFHGLSFHEACRQLQHSRSSFRGMNRPSPYPLNPERASEKFYHDALQDVWLQVAADCARLLWQPVGAKARAYLAARGLQDETLRHELWQVGYSPGMKIGGISVERGIVFPCFTLNNHHTIDEIHYITVRRPVDSPKYRKLTGHGANLTGLYGASELPGKENVVIVEGEFDALLLWQEVGNFVGVATPGSASNHFNFARFGKYLLSARHIFIAYDQDDAGYAGGQYWQSQSQRVQLATIPLGKDITDYYLGGGNLKEWVGKLLSTGEKS